MSDKLTLARRLYYLLGAGLFAQILELRETSPPQHWRDSPDFLSDETKIRRLEVLEEVRKHFPRSPLRAFSSWVRRSSDDLGGRTPAWAIIDGDFELVVSAAQSYVNNQLGDDLAHAQV